MHDVVFVDNQDVLLLQDVEGRLLRNEQSVLQRRGHHDGPRLAVPEQRLFVREGRSEGDVPGRVVEVGLDGLDSSGMLEELPVRHSQLHRRGLVAVRLRLVLEVLRLADVEVDPDRAVVRERRQKVAVADEAA